MKRLEFWFVFIDAERVASDLASVLHDAFAYYHFFPPTEVRWPHFVPVSLKAIDRHESQSQFDDLRMSLPPRAAERQGRVTAAPVSDSDH
jgi:hypothetical protein